MLGLDQPRATVNAGVPILVITVVPTGRARTGDATWRIASLSAQVHDGELRARAVSATRADTACRVLTRD